jgi:hypothetical protein
VIAAARTRIAKMRSKIGTSVANFFDAWAYGGHRIGAASPWGENLSIFFVIITGILISTAAAWVNLTHFFAQWLLWGIVVFGWFLVLSGILAWGITTCHFGTVGKTAKNSAKCQNNVDRA